MKQLENILRLLTGALVVVALLFVARTDARAQADTSDVSINTDKPLTKEKLNRIEDNLVRNLESKSVGMMLGGAQVVRELKAKAPDYGFAKVIIPLMRILKDKTADRAARMMAALALYDVNSDRGNYAIQREAELSDDDLLKMVCTNLTKAQKGKATK
jgi:hypothetical protein